LPEVGFSKVSVQLFEVPEDEGLLHILLEEHIKTIFTIYQTIWECSGGFYWLWARPEEDPLLLYANLLGRMLNYVLPENLSSSRGVNSILGSVG